MPNPSNPIYPRKKSKKRKQKNICDYCRKKMYIDYIDCPLCGGCEIYRCEYCGSEKDSETGKEL